MSETLNRHRKARRLAQLMIADAARTGATPGYVLGLASVLPLEAFSFLARTAAGYEDGCSQDTRDLVLEMLKDAEEDRKTAEAPFIERVRAEYVKCQEKWMGDSEPAALETLERLFTGAIV